jgi:hypothetical protein
MNPPDDSDDDTIVCSIVTVAVNFCSVHQGSSQNKMDPPVAIPMSYETNCVTPNPKEGTMVSMTLSGETFYFCTSGCSWLDKLCVNDMSRECSTLVRGECIEDCVESCNWLHHRILTMNERCCSTAAKVGNEWANMGGGQTMVQPVLDFVKGEGGATPHAAVVMAASALDGDRSFFCVNQTFVLVSATFT